MSDPNYVTVTATDGTRLALHVLGSGPPLVCLPGGPGRASAYLEDLAGLSASHTLLRLDLRGSGHSELPADRDSLAFPRLADDVEALRIDRGLDTVDLLGHSAGCLVALVYAARHPERVSRLILVTPSGKGFGEISADIKRIRASRSSEPWYAEAAEVEAELEYAPPHRRQRFDRGLRVFGYGTWDERARQHADSTDAQMSLRAAAAFPSDDFQAQAEAFRVELQAVGCPALVIVGGRDGMTGVQSGHLVAATLPNARVVELPDAGHYPWVDASGEFREVLVSFLSGAR
ncbi:MAG TPA: alpha/beta hydrolase [Mycobacteriales bacterium]|nr:alpha/beta hydrolase [Mycobacteriales bacterium]